MEFTHDETFSTMREKVMRAAICLKVMDGIGTETILRLAESGGTIRDAMSLLTLLAKDLHNTKNDLIFAIEYALAGSWNGAGIQLTGSDVEKLREAVAKAKADNKENDRHLEAIKAAM